jgi:hypothetical protein
LKGGTKKLKNTGIMEEGVKQRRKILRRESHWSDSFMTLLI